MVFGFWSAETGGDEILLDAHNGNAGSPLVDVTNGLFSVALGSGSLSDGAGPDATCGPKPRSDRGSQRRGNNVSAFAARCVRRSASPRFASNSA